MVDMTVFKPKPVQVLNIAVNEALGRISIDGIVNGKLAAVVFQADEIPKRVKTEDQYSRYLEQRLAESIEAPDQDPEEGGQ